MVVAALTHVLAPEIEPWPPCQGRPSAIRILEPRCLPAAATTIAMAGDGATVTISRAVAQRWRTTGRAAGSRADIVHPLLLILVEMGLAKIGHQQL